MDLLFLMPPLSGLLLALETAGADFEQCPPLLALVRDDLCLAILKMTRGGYTLEVLCEALGIMRCLWSTLRHQLKMQFEVIFKSIFLRALMQIRQVQWLGSACMGMVYGHLL